VVTICTTSLTFTNPTFCPHSVFMCFVWISEQTAIISLYNINWLVFITETESVYCAVRTGFLNTIQVIFRPNGLAMAQAIGRRPLMMDAAFNSKWVHVGYVVDKVTLTKVFLSVFRIFHVSIIPSMLYTPLHTSMLPKGRTGESWKLWQKQCFFGNRCALDRKYFDLVLRWLNIESRQMLDGAPIKTAHMSFPP
jgi:hypothetical protein